jgi:hypothetical protein
MQHHFELVYRIGAVQSNVRTHSVNCHQCAGRFRGPSAGGAGQPLLHVQCGGRDVIRQVLRIQEFPGGVYPSVIIHLLDRECGLEVKNTNC